MTGLRPIDYNGFVPDEPEANPNQTASTLLSGESLAERLDIPDDPHERNIWMSGYLAACSIVMAHQQARLEEILRRPS